jgi:hypothetical protein
VATANSSFPPSFGRRWGSYQHFNGWAGDPLRIALAQLPAKPKATISAKTGCGKAARSV